MLRISKLTDYAVALSAHLARGQLEPRGDGAPLAGSDLASLARGIAHGPEAREDLRQRLRSELRVDHQSVRALAAATGIPEPTVRKVLKILVRAGIVSSVRGTHGGYALARSAAGISVAEVVTAVEGPIGITECTSEATAGACELEGRCRVQGPWQRISAVIREALEGLTLAEMAASTESSTDPPVPLRVASHHEGRGQGIESLQTAEVNP